MYPQIVHGYFFIVLFLHSAVFIQSETCDKCIIEGAVLANFFRFCLLADHSICVYTSFMSDKSFTVLDLLDLDLKGHNSLDLRCIAGRRGLARVLTVAEINRPGLALCGFIDSFAYQRVQLFGRGEYAYLQKLQSEHQTQTIEKLFSFDIPCAVFTHNLMPDEAFLSIAEKAGCPVLQTGLESTDFSSRLLRVFSNIFAPKKTLHGVLVEVYGIGILLTGNSGGTCRTRPPSCRRRYRRNPLRKRKHNSGAGCKYAHQPPHGNTWPGHHKYFTVVRCRRHS